MKKKLAYSLGVYLAEHIMHTQMPSLYHNAWTPKVISTTWGEYKELKRLEEAWYSKRSSEETKLLKENTDLTPAGRYSKVEREAHRLSENEWNELLKYRYILKEKYLPHTVKFHVPYIDFSDEKVNKHIKKGFISAMWDSDHCEYSIKEEDIVFENEIHHYGPNNEYHYTHNWVKMKLDLNPPSSYTGKDWIEIKTEQNDRH